MTWPSCSVRQDPIVFTGPLLDKLILDVSKLTVDHTDYIRSFTPSRLFYTARSDTCVMAARYTAEMVRQMLYDGEAVMGLDSESDISDDEDPDYCPGGSGSVHLEIQLTGHLTSEDSSSVSSEEEVSKSCPTE
ncbi:unnamed protein product [Pleuronectes platessa]|uniref:Uncharacterized protein n=1 Tax=Pleuronectes platessa TaxID=8262 RepID=A0A9N7UVL5_PLEPL|nr:unnamed protein product [Pleuronectes platessa]